MFFSLIRNRRSIRKFLKKEIEPEKVEALIEAMLRAPSSRGFNPWKFIIITDQDLLIRLSMAKQSGSAFLKNAALGIVVCADQEKSDVWVEDTSIASIYIWLAAEALSLKGCWIQIRKRMHNETKTAEEYVRRILNIPESVCVESIMGIGYPDEEKLPHNKGELQYEKIYHNGYGIKT